MYSHSSDCTFACTSRKAVCSLVPRLCIDCMMKRTHFCVMQAAKRCGGGGGWDEAGDEARQFVCECQM